MRPLIWSLVIASSAFAQWPVSPYWRPEDLGIVVQHFDASALTGLTDGQAVDSWPDSSGNGYTASAANAGSCTGGSPVYKTAIQNGLPVVRFSGTQCYTS